MTIRSATVRDAAQLADIYRWYVERTAISFEYDPPTAEEFEGRIARTLERYPWLVLEDEGQIRGYAYAGVFKARRAYDRSCELSIYVERHAHGLGYGRALYAELERRLSGMGMTNLYACITDPIVEDETLTRQSEGFHRHLGFETVGRFHRCGYKFGRWYNMIWMEKLIGENAPFAPGAIE